ncbi:MAG: tRNA lysidine(34) synthetase TilS [Sphingomonas sp.]
MPAPDAAAVARFRADLARLCDPDVDHALIAVSGGPDSIALLLLARAAIGARCAAATVDHGLRAAAADEARFVAQLCAERGITHATLCGDFPDRAGRTANVSARARAMRYRLLDAHAVAIGATVIATAHHADDQCETVVMRLNRGAGVSGLAGIRARGGKVIRPLLGWRRSELAALVAQSGITAIDDPSNHDDRYDRARLRKALAESTLFDVEAVAGSAAALGEAEDAIVWMTDQLAAHHCRLDDARATLTGAETLPAEFQRRLVERCVRHIDPAAAIRGATLSAAIESLRRGKRVMLGNVLGDVDSASRPDAAWHFHRAPPRQSR